MAGNSDVELLEDLLAREQRLASAYEAALRRDAIDASLGELLLAHERKHVAAVQQALAGRGNPRASVPAPELTAALRGRRSFAEYMIAFESETGGMYLNAVPRIADSRLRQPLGSIMACGSAHVVALRESIASLYLTN
jgi:Ferritin-like domain